MNELQKKYLGKKIKVPIDNKILNTNLRYIIGNCDFIGYNEYLPSWGLQVTIDRLPISNVDVTKIELI